MILSEKILWKVSFCLPFNFVGHYLRLEKAWFLKILCLDNNLICSSQASMGHPQNTRISLKNKDLQFRGISGISRFKML